MELFLAALLIFAMRLADVTVGTLRIVYLVRGRRFIAGALGFFESLIWVLAAGAVLGELDDPVRLLAYAGGFAAGTMSGSTVERWLALGTVLIRIVSDVDDPPVSAYLHDAGFNTTVVNGAGLAGDVRIAFVVCPRKQAQRVLSIVHDINPAAFVTLEESTVSDLAPARRAASVRK